MPVYRDDTVRIFIDDDAVRIHAEGPDLVLELFRPINDLALVELVGQVGKYNSRQLDADTQVHPVRQGRDLEIPADALHPFAAASADGNNTLPAAGALIFKEDAIASLLFCLHLVDRRLEMEVHLILQQFIELSENDIILIRPQMTDRGVQQLQLVLDAELFDI